MADGFLPGSSTPGLLTGSPQKKPGLLGDTKLKPLDPDVTGDPELDLEEPAAPYLPAVTPPINPNGTTLETPGMLKDAKKEAPEEATDEPALADEAAAVDQKPKPEKTSETYAKVQANNGGGAPIMGEQASPASKIYPVLEIMGYLGIHPNQLAKHKLTMDNIKDGLDWEEVKLLCPHMTRQAFDMLSMGGQIKENGLAIGDDTISMDDMNDFLNNHFEPAAEYLDISEKDKSKLMERYLKSTVYASFNPKKAGKVFHENTKNVEGLWKEGTKKVYVKCLLDNCINENMKAVLIQLLINAGVIDSEEALTDEVTLSLDKLEGLFVTLNFLMHDSKPSDFIKGGKDLPHLEQEDGEEAFLALLTKETDNQIEVEEETEVAKAGGTKKSGKQLTNAEIEKLNGLIQKGQTGEAIEYCEELAKTHPNNRRLKDQLISLYVEQGIKGKNAEKALKLAVELCEDEKNATQKNKDSLLQIAQKWYGEVATSGEELTKEQIALADKVAGQVRVMAFKETNEAEKEKLKKYADAISALKIGPLPGAKEFSEVTSKEDAPLLEVKAAYDTFTAALEAEIRVLSGKADMSTQGTLKLAKMYTRLADLQGTQLKFEEAQKNMTAALELSASIGDGAVKEEILGTAKHMVLRLYEHVLMVGKQGVKGEREKKRVEAAKGIFEAYYKATDQDKMSLKLANGSTWKVSLEDVQGAKGAVPSDYEETQTLVGLLGMSANEPKTINGDPNPKYRSPEQRLRISITALYMLDKYQEDGKFFKKLGKWGNKMAKENGLNEGDPTSPKNKLKDYGSACEYLGMLSKANAEVEDTSKEQLEKLVKMLASQNKA